MRYSPELDDLVCGYALTLHRPRGPLDRDDVKQIGRLAAVEVVHNAMSRRYVLEQVKWRILDSYRRLVPEPVEVTEANGGLAPDVASVVAADDRVRALLDLLPPRQRALVQLVDLDGVRVTDVARALGVHKGTVASERHRAFDRMRDAA